MTSIDKILGDKVRERRYKLNITQKRLSEICGLHRTYITGKKKFQQLVIFKYNTSMFIFKKLFIASSDVSIIGSPASLKEVFNNTGMPVNL